MTDSEPKTEKTKLTREEMVRLDFLRVVKMQLNQPPTEQNLKDYDSAPGFFAHIIGNCMINCPSLTFEEMRHVINSNSGPCKEDVLRALDYTQEQMESNREKFETWLSVTKI